MPKQTRTRTEDQESRILLSRLAQLGIPTGPGANPPPEADRLILEQIDEARIYELPAYAIAAVVPARMIVLKCLMIADVAMMLPWDDFPLDLTDPEENPSYKHLVSRLPYHRSLLNRLLTSNVPLSAQRREGVIIALGDSRVPAKCHDETRVKVELLLRDERRNEFCFDLEARLDCSVMFALERRYRKQRERAGLMVRMGLFGPAQTQPVVQQNVSRERVSEPPYASREPKASADAEPGKLG
jgi:hypothetical protein